MDDVSTVAWGRSFRPSTKASNFLFGWSLGRCIFGIFVSAFVVRMITDVVVDMVSICSSGTTDTYSVPLFMEGM